MPVDVDGIIQRNSMFYQVDPDAIDIDDGFNPRQHFDAEAQASLKAYIKENGVPGVPLVRKVGDRIVLVDGERRIRCVRELIAEGVPIESITVEFERKGLSDAERLLQALSRNEGVRLTPLEEAHAFRRFLAYGWSQADIARRKGVSAGFVSGRLALLEAEPALVEAVKNGQVKTHEAAQIVRESRKSEKPAEAQALAVERVKSSRREASPQEKEERVQVQLRKTFEKSGIAPTVQALIDFALDQGHGRLYDALCAVRTEVERLEE